MKAARAATLMTLTLVCVLPSAGADFPRDKGPDLAVASIRLTAGSVVAEIVCMPGEPFPRGDWRYAKLQWRPGNSGEWQTVGARELPDINPGQRLAVAWPFRPPLNVKFTLRLMLRFPAETDENPDNDVLEKSFGPIAIKPESVPGTKLKDRVIRADQIQIIPGTFESRAKSKLKPDTKVKRFP